jgi:hypothetical protein
MPNAPDNSIAEMDFDDIEIGSFDLYKKTTPPLICTL